MADEPKPAGERRSIAAFFQQWQVVVTAIGAAIALWYGFEDRRRAELAINRTAVEAARADETRTRFFADPYNTLVEFEATFPDHAYCAALGSFVAAIEREQAAREGSGEDVPVSGLNAATDAVSGRLDVLLQAAGTSDEAVREAASSFAGRPDTPERCAFASVDLGSLAPLTVDRDCRRLIRTYAQSECLSERARLVRAEQAAAQPPPAEPASLPRRAAELAPGAACPGPYPTVFVQFVKTADRPAAEALQTAMRAAGWTVPGVEMVTGGQTTGDVRYYSGDQKACAEWLARMLGDWTGSDRSFEAISLEGRYRKLPSDQIEIWLPAGSEPAAL